jgi:hypothetical protein
MIQFASAVYSSKVILHLEMTEIRINLSMLFQIYLKYSEIWSRLSKSIFDKLFKIDLRISDQKYRVVATGARNSSIPNGFFIELSQQIIKYQCGRRWLDPHA